MAFGVNMLSLKGRLSRHVTRCLIGLGMVSTSMCVSSAMASEEVTSSGFALEYQGIQAHYSDLPEIGDWMPENKFNERGLALRWEFDNQWFVEGRASRGRHLRYLLEVEENEDGEAEFEQADGRNTAYALGFGKRIWLNSYFSVLPSVSYVHRVIDTPALTSDFDGRAFEPTRTREHSAAVGIKAEYRVISRFAVSLNFHMLSSGERQQGIGVAYYFY